MNLKTFDYCVKMLGFQSVAGTLFATDHAAAEKSAVLLFEQTNAIEPDGTLAERVRFYGPRVKQLTRTEANK